MESESEIVLKIREYLSSNNCDALKRLYQDDSPTQEEVIAEFWSIVTLLTQFINLEQFTWSKRCVNEAANMVYFISQKAPSRELYLALTEALDAFKDDCKLTLLLPSYANCLCQMSPRDLDWACPEAFSVVIAHLRGLPTPSNAWSVEILNMENNTEFTNFLLNDSVTDRYLDVGREIVSFLHQVKTSSALIDARGLFFGSYLNVIIHGLERLRFWRTLHGAGPNNVKDLLQLICNQLAACEKCVFTCLRNNPHELSNQQLLIAHYLCVVGLQQPTTSALVLPQVLSPLYRMSLALTVARPMLTVSYENAAAESGGNLTAKPSANSPPILELAVLLLQNLLAQLPPQCVSKDVWHNELWKGVFTEDLLSIAVYDNVVPVRQGAVNCIRRILPASDSRSRNRLFHLWFRNSKHSNLMAFFISLLKENIVKAVDEVLVIGGDTAGLSLHPLLGRDLHRLLQLIFLLPNGVTTDLMEIHDWIQADLNLLYYLLICRKMHQPTDIWSQIDWIQAKYLHPLREAIQLSRAHYKKEKDDQEKNASSSLLNDFDITLPKLSKEEQIQTLRGCLTSLDILEYNLSRITDVVDVHFQAIKRNLPIQS